MCTPDCISFGTANLRSEDITGKKVLEVGAYNVNGSLRPILERLKPASYTGVDICEGPGVDKVCKVEDLVKEFGNNSFDVVVSTEMMEHVRDWKSAINNIKAVLSPGGTLIITTRSKGFFYHGYPYDFWRYEIDDMKHIFSDFTIIKLVSDRAAPGVLIAAQKPNTFTPVDISDIALYSVVLSRRAQNVTDTEMDIFRLKRSLLLTVENIVFFIPKSILWLLRKLLQL